MLEESLQMKSKKLINNLYLLQLYQSWYSKYDIAF